MAFALDRLEVLGAERAAEAVGDRDEQGARDEDPRLGVRVAIRVDAALGLHAAEDVREVVVHLAHVARARSGGSPRPRPPR